MAYLQTILPTSDSLEPQASRLFERAYRAPCGFFKRSPKTLIHFEDIYASQDLSNQRYSGTGAICIRHIQGSLNRAMDFDLDFHPLQRHTEMRWLKIATAFLRGIDLPPIELIHVEGKYFVKDGHHRVSVARALGLEYLDAVVWDIERKARYN